MSPPDPLMTPGEREDIAAILVHGLSTVIPKPGDSRLSEGRHLDLDFARRLSVIYVSDAHDEDRRGLHRLAAQALRAGCAFTERERAMLEQVLAEAAL